MDISKEDFVSKFSEDLLEIGVWWVDGVTEEPASILNGKVLFTLTAGTHKIKLFSPYDLSEINIGSPT